MKYKKLKKNFSGTASWAVWDEKQPEDTEIITREKKILRSDVVLLSLFPPAVPATAEWGNYHGDKAGRKMMPLFAESSYRGAYITSLFKRENTTNEDAFLETELKTFIQEMEWLGASRKSLFVLFGNDAKSIFYNELIHRFNNVVACEHYASFRLSIDDWIAHNEAILQEHQRKTAVSFKLKPFRRLDTKYV